MDLIKITDLTNQIEISSRSLRYYEQMGLIESVRTGSEKYRYYDSKNIERLKQIMVLRKMQIPIKDIIRIYESEDMSVVVDTFVNRIRAIDDEVDALAELRSVVNDFLQAMIKNGVTKISALPILYEKMEKRLETLEDRQTVSYTELSDLSDRLTKPVEPAIINLPAMRVLSSMLKENPDMSDTDGFRYWTQKNMFSFSPFSKQGSHEIFEFQRLNGDVIIMKIPDDFVNESPYLDYRFEGGLFASANVYLDEDLGERFRSLIYAFDDNKYYQIDYQHDGALRHETLVEKLISPDDQRELVSLLIPVKKRTADPALFGKSTEIAARDITVEEIESQNPVLWTADVQLDSLTPVSNPHYRMNEDGEAEYIGWVIRSVLNTNVYVKLPFRIDMEFRLSGEGRTGIVFYHSEDTGYPTGRIGNRGFGVNMDNGNEQMIQAIRFYQPVFRDGFYFPERGAVKRDEPNRLTWIIGEKHLAVIINGEIRYCGVNFPYMALDLSLEEACPIVVGAYGNNMIYFRSIRISQLAETQKNKLKKGELTMVTKQSNNIIPIIHRLVTDEYGENYWFDGCARYVMECLGEKDYDYWFFAGLTGDVFTQHYTYTKYSGDALSCYMMEEKPVKYTEDIFAKCGYASTFVYKRDIQKNTEMYLQTLIAYIDKGIPVIFWGNPEGVFVGYEDYGKVLLYITGNNNQPERMTLEQALEGRPDKDGWIFIGEKKETPSLAGLYRESINSIPQHMSVKTDTYCFGPEAFREWARDVENGKFDGMTVGEFDTWSYYTNYVCVLATNSGCGQGFLQKAQELNPDMVFLEEVRRIYQRTGEIWCNDKGTDLEAIGGGFNITLETLQNKEKRSKIAAKIREAADCADEIMRIVKANR